MSSVHVKYRSDDRLLGYDTI